MSYCNFCKTTTDHQTIFCSQTQCKVCQKYGHINIYCPTLPCRVCGVKGHTLRTCQYERIYSKNHVYAKPDNDGLLECGCSADLLKRRIEEIKEYQPNMSYNRRYHCCRCLDIINVDKIRETNNTFLCIGCNAEFYENLNDNDNRKIQYKNSDEYRKNLVKCVVCQKEHKRASYLDGIGDFCDIHHQVAYKVWRDMDNPNIKLWTRIIHWTDTNQTRLSAYPMNQSAILRTVLRLQNKLDISYEEALNEKSGDFWNSKGETDDSDDWYYDDYSFARVINTLNINNEQRIERERLRKLIIESFEFHSNIDIENLLDNLHRNFGGNLENITFCKSCWCVVKKTRENLCDDCNPNRDNNQENLINNNNDNYIKIMEKMEEISNQINQLNLISKENKNEIEKIKAPFVLIKNLCNTFSDKDKDFISFM
ncbi:21221_t:CDS:1 [Cetraspora pellucida]|uniref:21221_t:CDS:1 n=1 Tax=Cetraspora pellucida TaxID=1433469 RepID=A0A9N9NCM7_9GLOM|nr:21221_t:CDS:1 [Cetraspora pellucida]